MFPIKALGTHSNYYKSKFLNAFNYSAFKGIYKSSKGKGIRERKKLEFGALLFQDKKLLL